MKAFKVLKIVVLVLVCAAVMSYVVMQLWNWLMPAVFGLRVISWTQALGLLVLSKLLLGGFHRHGGRCGGGWKGSMGERWSRMSEEERAQFRAGMRGRRGCFGGRDKDETGTSDAASA